MIQFAAKFWPSVLLAGVLLTSITVLTLIVYFLAVRFPESNRVFYSVNAFSDMAFEYKSRHGTFPKSWTDVRKHKTPWTKIYGENVIDEMDRILTVHFERLALHRCPEAFQERWYVDIKTSSSVCDRELTTINHSLWKALCE